MLLRAGFSVGRVQDAESCFILAARNYVDRGASVSTMIINWNDSMLLMNLK